MSTQVMNNHGELEQYIDLVHTRALGAYVGSDSSPILPDSCVSGG